MAICVIIFQHTGRIIIRCYATAMLETSLDAKERHWIWKLETLTPHGLNVADKFYSQNRSSRKKRSSFSTLVSLTHKYIYIYMHISLCRFVSICMHVYT